MSNIFAYLSAFVSLWQKEICHQGAKRQRSLIIKEISNVRQTTDNKYCTACSLRDLFRDQDTGEEKRNLPANSCGAEQGDAETGYIMRAGYKYRV